MSRPPVVIAPLPMMVAPTGSHNAAPTQGAVVTLDELHLLQKQSTQSNKRKRGSVEDLHAASTAPPLVEPAPILAPAPAPADVPMAKRTRRGSKGDSNHILEQVVSFAEPVVERRVTRRSSKSESVLQEAAVAEQAPRRTRRVSKSSSASATPEAAGRVLRRSSRSSNGRV
eukprot:Colp12_sorted_trinity150504_noHs@34567